LKKDTDWEKDLAKKKAKELIDEVRKLDKDTFKYKKLMENSLRKIKKLEIENAAINAENDDLRANKKQRVDNSD